MKIFSSKYNLLVAVSSLLVAIAGVVSSTASWIYIYQPKVPKCLHK